MIIDLNATVRVQLTDQGRAIIKRKYEDLKAAFPKYSGSLPEIEDEHGWHKTQLWELMFDFGFHLGKFFEDQDLKPFKTTKIEVIDED